VAHLLLRAKFVRHTIDTCECACGTRLRRIPRDPGGHAWGLAVSSATLTPLSQQTLDNPSRLLYFLSRSAQGVQTGHVRRGWCATQGWCGQPY